MSASSPSAVDHASAVFEPNARGFLRHWLVAGPSVTPYTGPAAPDHILRRNGIDPGQITPPSTASLGTPAPLNGTWNFHFAGNNDFIEFSDFYRNLARVEYLAFTEIIAPADGIWPARLWAAGTADLWVNDVHLTRLGVTRYRNPDYEDVSLPLQRGVNRVCVRMQCFGIRDTRILFGLVVPQPRGLVLNLPGAHEPALAARWLDSVRGDANTALISSVDAPGDVRVTGTGGVTLSWAEGARRCDFTGQRPAAVEIEVSAGRTILRRLFEFPANRPQVHPVPGDRRHAHLAYIAKGGETGQPPVGWNARILPLLARRILGLVSPNDAEIFSAMIAMVDARQDCADFVLAGLLRLELLGLASASESAELERAALAFRYWVDEPGGDAMCFQSENHTLLFHGCQLLAGRLYPDQRFGNSGRTGEEQVRIALPRIRAWLEKIEARGFEEFNSGTYMPITIGAMLNVVDFGGDAALATRISAQIDRIYRDLARHSFGGGIISPQGRIYRDVLFPEEAGTQVLLALASHATDVELTASRPARERTGDWAVFPASSTAYRPPADLADLIRKSVSTVYRHADVQIIVEKTPAWILTSVAVPALPREGEHPDNDLRPGGAGYQQHLWQATLARGCHVFVNHPGGTFDGTKSRPGYWHGNGLLPRVRQQGNLLQAIHVIADGSKTHPEITEAVWEWGNTSTVRPYEIHPISFTHAHWPSDIFEQEERTANWVFGRKGESLIGLWCSEPLIPHDDILTGRELRAESYSSAWLVICGDRAQDGSLTAFIAACVAREPAFDRTTFIMTVNGLEPLRWWERSEPMPS
ncbi:MAG: hypothetical protein H7Y06_14165 [Opitutaceae bacterium]|nr:hypothetical protein [Opitutaceae bacterium]